MSQVSWLTLDKIKGKNMSLQMKKKIKSSIMIY